MVAKFPAYRKGVVECTTPPDLNNVKGKSVVITGGKRIYTKSLYRVLRH